MKAKFNLQTDLVERSPYLSQTFFDSNASSSAKPAGDPIS